LPKYLASTNVLVWAQLVRLRFAVSPLFETVAGLRLLTVPHCSQVHQRWSAWAAQRLLDLGKDHSLLNILVAMPNIPEFLIPTPGVGRVVSQPAYRGRRCAGRCRRP
jgi:hypothetical protein